MYIARAGGSVAVAGNEDNDRLDGWQTVPVEPLRPGPDLIESDTWGEPGTTTSASAYAGRHHTASRSRLRLLVGAGVLALVAVAVVPLILGGSSGSRSQTITDGPGLPPLSPLTPESSDPAALSSQTDVRSSPTPPTATPTPLATSAAPPVATPKPAVKPPPPFAPITVEAEAGSPQVTLGGSAWVTPYEGASGGRVVRNLGNWDMRGGPGSLRLNDVAFPSDGSYVLAISFVHPDNEATRTAVITVSGVKPVTVSFTGSSRCCSVKEVTLVIPAGTRTITIANEQDRSPAVDKVVIRRP